MNAAEQAKAALVEWTDYRLEQDDIHTTNQEAHGFLVGYEEAVRRAQRAEVAPTQDAKDAALWRDLTLLHPMDLITIFSGAPSDVILTSELESAIARKRRSSGPHE